MLVGRSLRGTIEGIQLRLQRPLELEATRSRLMSGDVSSPSGSLPLSLLRRVNECCDRFEAAWGSGPRPAIERYVAVFPQPEQRAILGELLALEIELRCKEGEMPCPEEYERRFPDHRELIRDAFAARALERAAGGGGE